VGGGVSGPAEFKKKCPEKKVEIQARGVKIKTGKEFETAYTGSRTKEVRKRNNTFVKSCGRLGCEARLVFYKKTIRGKAESDSRGVKADREQKKGELHSLRRVMHLDNKRGGKNLRG